LPHRINGDRRALGSMTERHAAQGMTKRPAEQRLIKCRLVGSWGTVTRSHPRSWPAASLNWARWRFYCRGSASTSAGPVMSNATV
ncbi:hypothetical protein T10_7887, partial [Trichinella papuae]